MDHNQLLHLVTNYFRQGLQYSEIVALINDVHGETLFLRQLHRILRSLNLYRRKNKASYNELITSINDALLGSRDCFGYRLMSQWLLTQGIVTDRETVLIILKELDPIGVSCRSAHRFRRRIYLSKGPNFIWHLDGYDKLKPYGLAIHAAIDGWSRKLLWLAVGSTNNDPRVVGSYFMEIISRLDFTSKFIRADRGSENVVIAGIQRYFNRGNTDGGLSSFQFGTSVRNQRIESWWSIFRRNRANFWINFFKDMCDQLIYDPSVLWEVSLLRYCFIGILQTELDETLELWNNHRIRKVRNSECPSGRPNILYSLPDNNGGEDCKVPLPLNDVISAQQHVTPGPFLGCSEEMCTLITSVRRENNLEMPENAEEAKRLFVQLRRELSMLFL